MSRTQQYQASFTVGELDPLLRGRIDLQQYYSSVDLADNVVFEPQGGFSRRPGTRFVHDLTADNPNNSVVLIPFEFSTTQKFMIVASAYNTSSTIRFRFFADQTQIENLNSTTNEYIDFAVGTLYSVSAFDLQKLYFTQSADTLICTHENFAPFKITRGANNQTWTIAALTLTVPKTVFTANNTNPAASITPDGTTGNVTVSADADIFSAASVDQYINVLSDFGRARITEYVSARQVRVITEVPFARSETPINRTNTFTIKVFDHANIATGSTIVFKKNDGTTTTLTSLAVDATDSDNVDDTSPDFAPAVGNNTTADRIATAINNCTGFTASQPAGDTVTVTRTTTGANNLVVTTSDSTRLAVTDFVSTPQWELEAGYEDSFSNTRGWPRTCTFHEGRLYLGGSASEPATLFGSKVSNFFSFKASEGLDDDAIKVTLSTDSVNAITAMRSGRDLQIFTTGAEFFVPQADLTPITPSNVTVKSATRRGSKLGLRPQAAEGGTLFMSKEGKALREMLFSDVELSYVANNISLLCSHMILDPQRMALRPATDTTEGDLLLVVNGTSTTGYRAASTGFAGNIAAFMLNRPQQIVAASTFSTDGDFIDVAVDGDTIYCIVKRTIGGAAKYYIETFDDDRTTDCSLQYYANPVAPDQALPSNTTAGSLAHIQGEVVNIIRDDIVDANDTVASGNVTLGGVPSVYAEVGLPFTPTVITQPFEPRAASGSSQSTRRRVVEVTPILDNTQNLTVQGKEVQLQTLPLSGTGSVSTFTGPKKQMGFLGYSRDAQITISQSQPVFFTVLALDYKVSVGA